MRQGSVGRMYFLLFSSITPLSSAVWGGGGCWHSVEYCLCTIIRYIVCVYMYSSIYIYLFVLFSVTWAIQYYSILSIKCKGYFNKDHFLLQFCLRSRSYSTITSLQPPKINAKDSNPDILIKSDALIMSHHISEWAIATPHWAITSPNEPLHLPHEPSYSLSEWATTSPQWATTSRNEPLYLPHEPPHLRMSHCISPLSHYISEWATASPQWATTTPDKPLHFPNKPKYCK